MKKKCSSCGENKELSEYGFKKNGKHSRRSACKICTSIKSNSDKLTKRGVVNRIYSSQLATSRKRKLGKPTYSNIELREWLYSQKLFHELYDEWKASGYVSDKKPSVDRIDDYVGYTMSNLQLMTWLGNKNKSYADVKLGVNKKKLKGVVMIDVITNVTREFYSLRQAERETGINSGGIWHACNKPNRTAGGFKWKYQLGK